MDGSYTGSQWAGAVIQGPWNGVIGFWVIPTVTIPTEPQGAEGGWNSSSWVGIDGFSAPGYTGSNDVLQAGIQQHIDGGGNVSYVAWYEWFAPQQKSSPAYIFQTNITNFPVSPGQTVYCSAQYVNGSGYLYFANDTTGQHFSITLNAPPGANASGNSAEWISVRGPLTTARPTSSLPKFTPWWCSRPGDQLRDQHQRQPRDGRHRQHHRFRQDAHSSVTLGTDNTRLHHRLDHVPLCSPQRDVHRRSPSPSSREATTFAADSSATASIRQLLLEGTQTFTLGSCAERSGMGEQPPPTRGCSPSRDPR